MWSGLDNEDKKQTVFDNGNFIYYLYRFYMVIFAVIK